jgi:hypothetical protein
MVGKINRKVLDFIGTARLSIAAPFPLSKIEQGRPEDIRARRTPPVENRLGAENPTNSPVQSPVRNVQLSDLRCYVRGSFPSASISPHSKRRAGADARTREGLDRCLSL